MPAADLHQKDALAYQLRRAYFGETASVLIECLGEEKAFLFLDAFGGMEKEHVPRSFIPGHKWLSILGEDGFRSLSAAFGGERINFPSVHLTNAKRYRIARAILMNDISRREIARRMKVTERYVRMIAQDLRERGISVPVGRFTPTKKFDLRKAPRG